MDEAFKKWLEQRQAQTDSGAPPPIERRFIPFEVRMEGDGVTADTPKKITGHGSVWNTPADLYYFVELVKPGAFLESIANDDIRCLFNHDSNLLLGRNKAQTLRLFEDEVGLGFECIPGDTSVARDVVSHITRGDVSQCSIGFNALDEETYKQDGIWYREITKAKLWDVSPVTFPAFVQTDVSMRSAEMAVKRFRSGPEDSEQLAAIAVEAQRKAGLALIDHRFKELQLARAK